MSARTRIPLLRLGAAVVLLLVALAAAAKIAINAPDGDQRDEHAVTPSVGYVSKSCQENAARAEARARVVTGHGRRVVVIGDSWAVGRDLDARKTWPVYLDGEVHVAAFGGSTISADDWNHCGNVSFADRAPEALAGGADLVVVEGGLNDIKASEADIRTGLRQLLHELHGYRVVFLAPAPTPSRATRVPRVDAILGDVLSRRGIPYVPTDDIPISYRSDGLHPDAVGHQIFGEAVAERIAALPVVPRV